MVAKAVAVGVHEPGAEVVAVGGDERGLVAAPLLASRVTFLFFLCFFSSFSFLTCKVTSKTLSKLTKLE